MFSFSIKFFNTRQLSRSGKNNPTIHFFCLIICVQLMSCATAQKMKYNKEEFCGPQWVDKGKLANLYGKQFRFLNINAGDTVVDIGAQGGWYEAAFSVSTGVEGVQFILVDIDSSCQNEQKLQRMLTHYAQMQDRPIANRFSLVINTPDSLYLPLHSYSKVLLINTLHEIPNQAAFVQSINRVMRSGGELLLMEIITTKEGELHGGCRKPLFTSTQLHQLMEQSGFKAAETLEQNMRNHVSRQMIRFVKQ